MPSEPEDPCVAIRRSLSRKALAAARQRAALGRVLGVGEREMLAIQHLARSGALTPGQLGSLLRLTTGGVTMLLQRLERDGHVTREPHARDRRSVVVRLTPQIERRATAAYAPAVAAIDALVDALAAEEREVVARFLEQAAEAAERHADALIEQADADARASLAAPAPGLWA